MTNDSDSNSNGIVSRIRQARERINRAETSARAKKRAKQRRIENEEPDNLSERVAVASRRAKERIDEVSEETAKTADAVDEFAETKFGVSIEDSIDDAKETFESAGDRSEGLLDDFDASALEEPMDETMAVSPVETGDIEPVESGDESMTDASDPVMDGDDLL